MIRWFFVAFDIVWLRFLLEGCLRVYVSLTYFDKITNTINVLFEFNFKLQGF